MSTTFMTNFSVGQSVAFARQDGSVSRGEIGTVTVKLYERTSTVMYSIGGEAIPEERVALTLDEAWQLGQKAKASVEKAAKSLSPVDAALRKIDEARDAARERQRAAPIVSPLTPRYAPNADRGDSWTATPQHYGY